MNEKGLNRVTEPKDSPDRNRLVIARVFIGDQGLRSGWRLFLYIVVVVLLEWLFIAVLRRLLGHGPQVETPGRAIPTEISLLLAAVIPSLAAARLEHRPWGKYGLPLLRQERPKFLTGLIVGFVALSALLFSIHLFHGFYLGAINLTGTQLVRFALLWAVAFLLVGVAEEFLFRGYSLYALATGIGFWPAAGLLSALFGAIHLRNIGEDWIGALAAASMAFVFAFSLWRTGSLWFAVGLHASWDWAESFFYGVPDSGYQAAGTLFTPRFAGSKWITGGSVGPEGSVLAFVIVIAMALTIHFLYPERQWQTAETLRASD